jgi:FkbM family methyltransferase
MSSVVNPMLWLGSLPEDPDRMEHWKEDDDVAENPHAHRMDELVREAKAAAANPEHVWDQKAIDWPLTSESTVVEVGGFKGRWALQIAERYHPRLFVFEPQLWAYEVCKRALGDAATVVNFGIGDRGGTFNMADWETDGCSFTKADAGEYAGGTGAIREIGAAFSELEIGVVDLMLMNIEGDEYRLLPHMLGKGILPKRLMVQFHTFIDEYGMALAKIHQQLEDAGYRIVWTYGVMLTAWERD